MKTIPLIFSLLFSLTCIFPATAFSQEDSGGGSECPISYSIKKNNGSGVCKGDALVTVIFNPVPTPGNIPRLTAIYYKGQTVGNMLPVQGHLVNKGRETHISYCVTEAVSRKNSFSNISPANKLVLEFTYPNGTSCRTHPAN